MKFIRNIIFFVCPLAFSSCTFRTDPGEGFKIGRIVKVSHQGLIFKTWEATLVRGGLNEGSGVIGNSFEFTIEDPKLFIEAQQLMEEGAEVIVRYRVEGISALSRSEHLSPYFCIQIIKK